MCLAKVAFAGYSHPSSEGHVKGHLNPVKRSRKIALGVCIMFMAVATTLGYFLYRGVRAGHVAYEMVKHIRYQLESGEDIADTPAGEALAVSYLETIFGDNQELLGKLKGVVQRGLEDTPSLNLGTVSAMFVTYHRDDENNVKDVVAHVLGGFPLGRRKPGFHTDGYFRHLIDHNIWNLGNAVISLLGRDMILFAEESVADRQQEMLEALLVRGDVVPFAESLEEPMYFTAVFPDPKRLVPLQLRHHIQALVIKGTLSDEEGLVEFVLLTPSSRSAAYALSVLSDMKMLGETALRTKWHGVEEHTPWKTTWVDTWWSYEMVNMSEQVVLEKQHNILRGKTTFGQAMVNAFVKSIERMGRDLAQQRGTLEEKLDPRLVDERLRASKPLHYWSDAHRWGPNWPFGSPGTGEVQQVEASLPPTEPASGTPPPPPPQESL